MHIFNATRLFSLRDHINLFKIHFDFIDNDNKIEIFDSNDMKIAFIDVKIKISLLKFFQNLFYVHNVFFFNIIINENIIKIS